MPGELGYDDDLDADRIIGATGSRVPGSKGCPVLLGGEGHERETERRGHARSHLMSCWLCDERPCLPSV